MISFSSMKVSLTAIHSIHFFMIAKQNLKCKYFSRIFYNYHIKGTTAFTIDFCWSMLRKSRKKRIIGEWLVRWVKLQKKNPEKPFVSRKKPNVVALNVLPSTCNGDCLHNSLITCFITWANQLLLERKNKQNTYPLVRSSQWLTVNVEAENSGSNSQPNA